VVINNQAIIVVPTNWIQNCGAPVNLHPFLMNEPIRLQSEKDKQTIAELQSKVDDLNDFIENASIPLHWVNGSGIIIWANQAELDLLGYTKEEYIGKHVSHFHADRETIEDILTRLTKKQTLKNYPARLKCKNGEVRSVLINSNVRWDGDKFVHTRCFTRDISDLKLSEQKKVETVNELIEKNSQLKAEIVSLKAKLNQNI
jgi:two-component system, OmpR family, sensor histidine kinase VicK